MAASSFNTITLANPVSVTLNQWVAVTFMGGGNTIMYAGSGCGTAGGSNISGKVADAQIDFASTTPTVGNTFQSTISGAAFGCEMVGGSFQTTISPSPGTTQCYGNCGAPPITLVNTNSTHTINFNLSITILYIFQSNLNGVINNMTVTVARDYSGSPEEMSIAIYEADPNCPSGAQGFTPTCPGFIQARNTIGSFAIRKETVVAQGGSFIQSSPISVTNGQWVGIAVTADFKGLDLNDTNTSAALFVTNGRVPTQINQISSFNPTSFVNMQARITGNVITPGPGTSGTFGGGCSTPICGLNSFTDALGGGTFGGIVAFGILFGLIGGLCLYATRQHDSEGHIKGFAMPMWLLGIFAILLLIGMSAAGALPPWIPLVIIAFVAWLITSAVWSHRREQGGTGAAM